MSPRIALVMVAVVLLPSSRAWGQSDALVEGRRAYLSAEFDEAGARFESVRASASASRAELAEALRYLAVLALARREHDRAGALAVQALSLEPAAAPPPGASPQALALFDEARARARVPLEASLRLARGRDGSLGGRILVQHDPGALAQAGAVACSPAPDAPVASSGERFTLHRDAADTASADLRLRPPARAPLVCAAAVRATEGAVLATARLEVGAAAPAPVVRRRRQEGHAGPWIAIGVVSAVAAAAIVTGLVLSQGSDGAHLGRTEIVP